METSTQKQSRRFGATARLVGRESDERRHTILSVPYCPYGLTTLSLSFRDARLRQTRIAVLAGHSVFCQLIYLLCGKSIFFPGNFKQPIDD
jgi:hypothetical protein